MYRTIDKCYIIFCLNNRLVKNAISSLTRGGATALVALVLPPVLVRHMPTASYSVWVLALQAAAYIAYLDVGLQAAVGRYVAYANEKRDAALRDGIFSSALVGLSLAATVGFLLVLGIALAAHRVFPAIPPALLPSLRFVMLVVGAATALSLPGSAWSGIFIGIQRYEIPAIAIGSGRLLGAIGLIWAAVTGQSLALMAILMALASLYTYGLQIFLQRRMLPEIHFHPSLITRPVVRELSGYCFSLTIWSLSMLLVNGLDLILVGRFQFSAVTPYAVSATLITFLAGMQNAIFGVIMPHAAELHANENPTAIGHLLVKSTRLGVLLLLIFGLPLIAVAPLLIRLWIGPQFAVEGGRILTILVIANMIRLTGTPYASILLGTGEQKQVILSPLSEGITNLIVSITLGWKFGAIGVAWGTLIGGIVGILVALVYSTSRTQKNIRVGRFQLIGQGVLVPCLILIPAALLALIWTKYRFGTSDAGPMLVCAPSIALGLIFFFRTSRSPGEIR